MKNSMNKIEVPGIVLVHGAGLGSFIWNNVAKTLSYPILSLDFPNRNMEGKVNVDLHFEDYVQKAILDTERFGKKKLIIVSHSIGGLIGLRIAERFREETIGFVAVGAAIPRNGKSFVSCLPVLQKIIIPLILRLAGTKPPDSVIESSLCHDLDASQKNKIIENFTPESRKLFTDHSRAKIPKINKIYVLLENDKEFSMSIQQKMAKNLDCEKRVTLNSGHLPMLSTPKELSRIIQGFIRSCT